MQKDGKLKGKKKGSKVSKTGSASTLFFEALEFFLFVFFEFRL